jgi:hypothetical protein
MNASSWSSCGQSTGPGKSEFMNAVAALGPIKIKAYICPLSADKDSDATTLLA